MAWSPAPGVTSDTADSGDHWAIVPSELDGVGVGSLGVGSGDGVGDEPVREGVGDADAGGVDEGLGTGDRVHEQVRVGVALAVLEPAVVVGRGGRPVQEADGVGLGVAAVGSDVGVLSFTTAGGRSGGVPDRSWPGAASPPTTAAYVPTAPLSTSVPIPPAATARQCARWWALARCSGKIGSASSGLGAGRIRSYSSERQEPTASPGTARQILTVGCPFDGSRGAPRPRAASTLGAAGLRPGKRGS